MNKRKKSLAIFFSLIFLLIVSSVFVSASLEGPGSGLVAQYKFDEALGAASFADSSSNGNTGTCSASLGSCPTAGVPGKVGTAVQLDGVNDFVSVPHSASLNNPSSYTWSVNINPSFITPTTGSVVMIKGSTPSNWVGLQVMPDLSVCAWFDAGTCVVRSGPNSISLNTWKHVTVVFDNGADSMTLYVNGIQFANVPETRSPTPNINPLTLGATQGGGGFHFNGLIDEVRIYDRALSPTEVGDLATPPVVTHSINTIIYNLPAILNNAYSISKLPEDIPVDIWTKTGTLTNRIHSLSAGDYYFYNGNGVAYNNVYFRVTNSGVIQCYNYARASSPYDITCGLDGNFLSYEGVSVTGAGTDTLIVGASVTLPAGVYSVTGTVTATGGTNFGDPITVTGGASGGTLTVQDINKVGTVEVYVPANTETSLSINPNGEPIVFSTTANSAASLGIRNVVTRIIDVRVEESNNNKAIVRLLSQQKLELFSVPVDNQGKLFGIKSPITNLQNVKFAILVASSSASDCNKDTCASLGGTCVGNWCMPNAEGGISSGGLSISGKLSPGEDFEFKSEQTISGQKMLTLKTTSGLANLIKTNSPLVPSGAEFKIGAGQGVQLIKYLDLVKNTETLLLMPLSDTTEGVSVMSKGNYFSSFGIKARELSQGKMNVAGPAKYEFDLDGDGVKDLEFNSRINNQFFNSNLVASYDKLSPTKANGENLMVFTTNALLPIVTLTYHGVAQTKTLALNSATAFNFIILKDKLGNLVTVAGNSRTITGSLIEEISPAAIIEGWNYWYTATDDNYWTWSVVLESLPTGCTADKTSASATVANGVQTLAFNVDCGTATSTTGSVISGYATKGQKTGFATKDFATKGRAQLLSEFSECTKTNPKGAHICQPSQQFREEATEVVKGVMNPTGSVVSELEKSGLPIFLVALLTLAGVIVLITIQIRRKTVDW